jgi:phenylacetate-coenzyme A ligase PaaK-like adenylate-forming protein
MSKTEPSTRNAVGGIGDIIARLTQVAGRRISNVQILGYLIELEKNLGMNQNTIFEYQNRKLRRLISHAYMTVPFYRRLFEKHKIDPNDIQTVKDLDMLPVIDKSVLRSFPLKERISRAVTKQPLTKLLTGGSTGQPFEIYVTQEELNMRAAHRWRIYFNHGYNIFDKEAAVEGLYAAAKKGLLSRIGLFRRIEVPYQLPLPDQLKIISNERADVYEGYPSRLHMIAKYAEDAHVEIRKPKAIFSDSETLLPPMRNAIENVFRVKVSNIYDSFEFGFIAWECGEHKGLHINCDSQIVQIMKDNVEVEDGNSGELVITSLDSYAMPLIRYNTRDVGTKSKERCSCGIDFPMLATMQGRIWDFLLSPSGEEISPLIVTSLVAIVKGVLEYQFTQNAKEELNIELVIAKNYDPNSDFLIKKQLADLYHFRQITISHPQTIKRSPSGKFRSVIRNF